MAREHNFLMKALVSVLVLLANLVYLHSFTLSHRWIARTITRTNAMSISKLNRKLDEVYIGELPPLFSESDLKNLLQQKHISNYINASVSSYGTSDQEMYGNITFACSRDACNAVSALKGADVDGKPTNAALMPGTARIRLRFDDRAELLLRCDELIDLRKNENVASVHLTAEKDAYVTCWSPPQIGRVLHQLSVCAWKDRMQLSLVKNNIVNACVVLHNLDPSITQDGLTSVLNELLGPGQFDSVCVKEFRSLRSRLDYRERDGYFVVPSAEKAEEIVKLLNKYSFMDRPVIAERVLAPHERRYKMFLGNVDPEESIESVKRLCADALKGEIAGLHVSRSYKNGVAQPSCTVYFPSAELLSQCIKALNGRVWKGRTLLTDVPNRCTASQLCLGSIPVPWTASEIDEKFRKVLGEIPVRKISWNKNPSNSTASTRVAFVDFFSDDHKNAAKCKFVDAGFDVEEVRPKRDIVRV